MLAILTQGLPRAASTLVGLPDDNGAENRALAQHAACTDLFDPEWIKAKPDAETYHH